MLSYSLYKEIILCPAPRCSTVRYRKGIRLSSPTCEELEHGPPPEHRTEPADGRGRSPKAPTGTAVAQLSEAGLGILGAKESKGMRVWSAAVVLAVLSSHMSAGSCSLVGRRDNVPCLTITAISSVYCESIKRELKIRPTYECRCDERLKTKAKEFTRLTYTGLIGGGLLL